MKTEIDIIIDLETLSTRRTAAIVCIGAVALIGDNVCDEFYLKIDIESALSAGGKVDGETLAWWLRQDEDARLELYGPDRTPLRMALFKFSQWVHEVESHHTGQMIAWGNGASFDLAILAEAYKEHGIDIPWEFWNERDLKTALTFAPQAKLLAGPFIGTKHHALDDAHHEAKQLVALRRILRVQADPEIKEIQQ